MPSSIYGIFHIDLVHFLVGGKGGDHLHRRVVSVFDIMHLAGLDVDQIAHAQHVLYTVYHDIHFAIRYLGPLSPKRYSRSFSLMINILFSSCF